jgi:hypothetical protein
MVIRLLHNKQELYLPEHPPPAVPSKVTDTKEEMIEFFDQDVTGQKLTLKKLMPRRNYAICEGDDYGGLMWRLIVQGEGQSGTQIYGPLMVPMVLGLRN